MSYKYKNGDKIPIDLKEFFKDNHNVLGVFYEDDDGNVEIYVPETEQYTGFYLKVMTNRNKD
jgi:hypothetical protein